MWLKKEKENQISIAFKIKYTYSLTYININNAHNYQWIPVQESKVAQNRETQVKS